MIKLSDIEMRILEILQIDATRTLDSIADEVDVSVETCRKHIKALEAARILEQRVALIDNEKIGLPQTVFVTVHTDDHSKMWSNRFKLAVDTLPEIVEFYHLDKDGEYILKMMVSDVADYNRVHQALLAQVNLFHVSARFATQKLKFTTELPLRSAQARNP